METSMMTSAPETAAIAPPLRVGVAGPVGSGKTTIVECLSRELTAGGYEVAVVTNDIFTQEDAEFLRRRGVLPQARVRGVETGGCPHSAIRDDASMNLEAVCALETAFPQLHLVLVESGGDNLAAAFSPELVDVWIYVIDVSAGFLVLIAVSGLILQLVLKRRRRSRIRLPNRRLRRSNRPRWI